MRQGLKILSLVSVAAIVFSCQRTPHATAAPGALAADAKSGFVIRMGIGIYDISDGAATLRDSLLLGEKLGLLGDTRKASLGGDQVDFIRVKRESGAVGWAQADYVISKCVLSIVKADDTMIYREASDTAAAGSSLSSGTIVARHDEPVTAPFVKITWCNPGTGALSQGLYIRDTDISTKPDDVQSAVILLRSTGEKNPEQKKSLLQSAAKSYPGSLFITRIEDAIAAITSIAAPPETRATEKFFATMTCTDNAVNVRDSPDEKAGSVVATLTKGQTVAVEEQTTESYTIGRDTAPWYRIREPAGWVFGAWLGPEE